MLKTKTNHSLIENRNWSRTTDRYDCLASVEVCALQVVFLVSINLKNTFIIATTTSWDFSIFKLHHTSLTSLLSTQEFMSCYVQKCQINCCKLMQFELNTRWLKSSICANTLSVLL